MQYQFYDPHPHICHNRQYHVCKYHTNCPLWYKCSSIKEGKPHQEICKQDCISCSYQGCSLSMEDRKTAPIYIDHVVQGEMLDLNIETIRFREKNQHYRHHAQLLYFYKTFFGDELNRRAKYRELNRAAINEAQKQKRRQNAIYRELDHADTESRFSDVEKAFLPCCGDCFQCEYEDCILTDEAIKNAKRKARDHQYYLNHQDTIKKRVKERRERLVSTDPQYYAKEYAKYRERQLLSKKQYAQEHKEKIRAYQKAYQKKNAERLREQKAAYRAAHREELREKARQYYRTRVKNQKDAESHNPGVPNA